MSETGLLSLVCCDLGAIVRGRAIAAADLDAHLQAGVGWVPANHALTPLGPLAEPNPFDSIGDLRLLPDPDSRVHVPASAGSTELGLVLCDIVETDGSPWPCCPRGFLRDTLAELERTFDIHVVASFEHEFQLIDGGEGPRALPFSLDALRRAEPFGSEVMSALAHARVEPERFFAEFAAYQFEIPVRPARGLAAADRAVLLREVVREVARREGRRATFTPLLDPAEAGNGVHVHVNLLDAAGRSMLYDASRPGSLSEVGGRFAAGILTHARALTAITAPSPVSAARLAPHRWSAGAVCVGLQNREAMLRLPPLLALGDTPPAEQMRLEFRAADASANPYLALGAILRAGIEGLRTEAPEPPILEKDPAQLGEAEAQRFGVGALPGSLGESLGELEQDRVAREWMPAPLLEAYLSVKRAEASAAREMEQADVCGRYAQIF